MTEMRTAGTAKRTVAPASSDRTPAVSALIDDEEVFASQRLHLRRVRPADCTERYVGWLRDDVVNRYLETRWREQDLDAVRTFVAETRASRTDILFAIVEAASALHIGNIKLGAINRVHAVCDVSYFIGDRKFWGRGYATEAIVRATEIAFLRLGLHRVEAGVYDGNVASVRALEKAGFQLDGRLRSRLRLGDEWVDHLLFGKVVGQ
jgi:[ribosomal protein S5]-alanine N-acetyltransferase